MIKTTIKECPNNLSGIYKIDFPNGKSYIGKSVDIKRRMVEHNHDKRQIVYLPITKYFNNNIPEFYILEIIDRDKLSEREKYWIAYYQTNTKEKGYNLTTGGDGGALGVDNVASKFSQNDLDNIIKLLRETDIPMYKIAQEYSCVRKTIESINKGETYFNKELSYPIRKQKYKPKKGVGNPNSKLTKESLESLIYDLQNTQIQMKDLQKKYNISLSVITNINTGRRYYNSKLKYPLRIKNTSRKKLFSINQLLEIKSLLQNKNLSMKLIGEKFGCSSDIISDINSGNRQRQAEWTYPIR